MGLIGYGALGRRVAELARSDVLTILCPLSEETRGLIGAAELARMPRDALLINCARGGIVDEAALAASLAAGTIGGAGVDVLAEEPPRHGSPLLTLRLPTLIVTPHTAWASVESMENLAEQLIGNIEAYAAGAGRNVVTGL